jgi:hypothetical protein
MCLVLDAGFKDLIKIYKIASFMKTIHWFNKCRLEYLTSHPCINLSERNNCPKNITVCKYHLVL